MATYKVLQDIEAEDKLVGPLSLRQFIYAAVAAVALYICVLALTRHVPFLIIFFLPVVAVCGFFAFPWKGEQPTEIWAIARLRFMIKPRIRIWNQSGIKEVVTVTAPKNLDANRPKVHNLSQTEVRSRLKALADTIDSRGWATRNVNFRYYTNASDHPENQAINASGLQPGAVPMDAFLPANDMLDDQSPVSQKISSLLTQSAAVQRQQAQMTASGQLPQPQPQAVRPAAPAPHLAQPRPASSFSPVAPPPITLSSAPTIMPADSSMPQLPAPIAVQAAPAMTAAATAPMPPIPAAYETAPIAAPVPAPLPTVAQSSPATPPIPPAAVTTETGAPNRWFIDNNSAAPAAPPPISLEPTPVIAATAPASEAVTAPADPAILKLANNNDLNVATIAREANRAVHHNDGEVEVQLR